MKNLTLSLFFISFLSLSFSQEKLVWHEDLKEAITISQKENKPLMLFLREVIGAVGVFVYKKKYSLSQNLPNGQLKMLFLWNSISPEKKHNQRS